MSPSNKRKSLHLPFPVLWRRGDPAPFPSPPPRTLSIAATLLLFLAAGTSLAGTIIIDSTGIDRVAGIVEWAPRQSWSLNEQPEGRAHNTSVGLVQGRGLLVRFALDAIPKGNRIIHAELVVNVPTTQGNEPRFYLWRILAEWGIGVCHQFRMTHPKPLAWTRPGARAFSTDRATRPTDIVRIRTPGDVTINVTEDVDLWYTGTVPNHGWLFTVEDPAISLAFHTPLTKEPGRWLLRVTYEPEVAP
ncbi:MAG: hypothetical protein A2498_02560 [Lentisphaerae bacterium RIFOXYC12_FULL_60_16]|nr:MAG: hypothetical protein A2498_02560 [Lentisphaerae bacterium RIFOXYC12_FULL_60_16]